MLAEQYVRRWVVVDVWVSDSTIERLVTLEARA